MSTGLLTAGLVVVLAPVMYAYLQSLAAARFPTPRNKRICLLIAHPDDEAMFFSPTVLALTRPETGNHVKIMCLSSGNADGLGETRKKELVKSGMLLGLRNEEDVTVIESESFPDSMTTTWDPTAISDLLTSAFAPDAGRAPDIDILVTFDSQGVSSHPNHISLYHGARAFVSSLRRGGSGTLALYSLTSVSFLRKYTSILDAVATLATSWGFAAGGPPSKAEGGHPGGLVFMNPLGGGSGGGGAPTGHDSRPGGRNVATAWRAMTEAHLSQMVWFRYGWITLSRYMVVNDLRLETVE
ncbi:N-acetylglucosaminyl-phosphatidylinositol de-N-acetylase [Gaeumannomyces tritici R3-111a-1]|uniref:N-acetylglucosaminylphosphatidylinositol deacetylase n=1 Tax=Gaeumannomyces tritici (strain R3-111a-1) TaxID=644352 RepID=J3NIT4_GAET3|nr:N-acetylglucosaminyl-phosphatidylinositol de-N-acetylase [Gaeumannomyces tritici R3-111a-1]EJT81184.1 N-acetylglucosaminyl-phosphatidylinositol de-N-acetylase [Gaeumannomyces tritici R3-111a-1]